MVIIVVSLTYTSYLSATLIVFCQTHPIKQNGPLNQKSKNLAPVIQII